MRLSPSLIMVVVVKKIDLRDAQVFDPPSRDEPGVHKDILSAVDGLLAYLIGLS